MTSAVDLAAPLPGTRAAPLRAAFTRQEAHRRLASWSASLGVHVLLAIAAVAAFLLQPPAPPAPVEAIAVEIVMVEPQPPAEAPGEEGSDAAPAAPASATASAEAPQQFDVVLPNRVLPQVLALEEPMTWEGEPTYELALPSNIRAALAAAYYCRSTALGIAAERRRCPPILNQFALNARLAAMDPNLFYEPEFVEAAQRLGLSVAGAGIAADAPYSARGGARSPVNGRRDPRLAPADEMRDRLPPAHPAPFFGD